MTFSRARVRAHPVFSAKNGKNYTNTMYFTDRQYVNQV
jgi:hypothetical protein